MTARAPAKKRKGKAKVKELTPKALQSLVNARFGAGTMRVASDPDFVIERLPTGILTIDVMLRGGFPRGRSIEIYGAAAVAKTYLSLVFMATCQAAGLRCAYVDVEKTFDPAFAEAVGINLDELVVHVQTHGPRCVDFIETLLRSELFDVIVIDSTASLLPMSDYENDMEAGSYGMEQAKLMSKAMRKLTAANNRTVLLFLNQTRENVGVSFGKKTLAPGGRAMSHYASQRIEVVKTESLKRKGDVVDHKTAEISQGDVVYGHRVLVRSEKDKAGGVLRPHEETTFVFDYEQSHHDHVEDLIFLGRTLGFIKTTTKGKSERWYLDEYEDESQAGRTKFARWLKKNKAVQEELEEMIRTTVDGEGWEEVDE